MLYDSYFKNPKDVPLLLDKIRIYSDKTGPVRLMEICGTHTMAPAAASEAYCRKMYSFSPVPAVRSALHLPA